MLVVHYFLFFSTFIREIFLSAISSPRSVFFVELLQDLYVLSTEVVHVRKSDHAVNTNFPLPPPFQRSVA